MKRFFKIIISVILIIGLYSTWGIVLTNRDQTREAVRKVYETFNPPCSKPLEFSIGRVDPEFKISRKDFAELSQQAVSVWNSAAGKEVLRYNPTAEFRVNLIFDSRQSSANEARKIEGDLKELESSHEILADEYETLNSTYQKKIDTYNKALKEYENDLEEYNKEVEYWNEKGGAPEDVYEDLQDKKEDLEKELKKIRKQQKEINNLAQKSNEIVVKENKIADDYNRNLDTYKSRFGGVREFEKGVFDGSAINIYQFEAVEDLRLTLIHEFGHYLGIDHVADPRSIMYYLIGEQNMEDPVLSKEDLNELNKICNLRNTK